MYLLEGGVVLPVADPLGLYLQETNLARSWNPPSNWGPSIVNYIPVKKSSLEKDNQSFPQSPRTRYMWWHGVILWVGRHVPYNAFFRMRKPGPPALARTGSLYLSCSWGGWGSERLREAKHHLAEGPGRFQGQPWYIELPSSAMFFLDQWHLDT